MQDFRNFSNPGPWCPTAKTARTFAECQERYIDRETVEYTRDFIRVLKLACIAVCFGCGAFGVLYWAQAQGWIAG